MSGRSDIDCFYKELSRLSFLEKISLFYKLFDDFKEVDFSPDGNAEYIRGYVISIAYYCRSGVDVSEVLALPNLNEDDFVSRNQESQSGRCKSCGVLAHGFSKISICPLCGSSIEMT